MYADTTVALFIHSSLDMDVASMSMLLYITLPRTPGAYIFSNCCFHFL